MASTLTPQQLQQQIRAYTEELKHYEDYARVLERIFKTAFPLAVVQVRPKTVSSFAEKAVRKHEQYPDAVHMLTDLCGARIIVQTLDQIATVRQFIEANFTVVEFDDKSEKLSEEEFGYRDTHYIIQLREDRDLKVEPGEWDSIGDRKAEIQVRTVLQHAWADILHDRIYKPAISVPREWKREANRLSAILEKTDDSFSQLADALDAQTPTYEVFLPPEKLAREIETLTTILATEKDPKQRPRFALKLARVFAMANRWKEATDTLTAHWQDTPEFVVDLGYALCCGHKGAPTSRQFREGIRRLEGVAQPQRPARSPDWYVPSAPTLSVQPVLRAKALYRLGRIHALYAHNCALAANCLQAAYTLRPENPYYHVAYVQARLCDSTEKDLLSLVAASLRADIERCQLHIRLGIELPNALFTSARCRLLLGETSACLCAYARAVEMTLQKDSCVPGDLLDEEIITLEQLAGLHPSLADQVLMLLHLVRWRRNRDCPARQTATEASRTWLEKRRLRRKPFQQPVLLVIGGADLMPRKKIQSHWRDLFEALEFFEGTVVSGGTTSGIPGVVGDVTRMLQEQKSQLYDLIAYVPKRPPSGAKTHPSYRVVRGTEGSNFSEKEVIACWVDLLLGGLEPEKIVALGFNGGRIADFEYRLALALGAHVGLLQDSGRAAAVLLTDPDWKDHARLRVVADDPLLVWAFVSRHNHTVFSPEQVNEAAPQAHEFYRQKRWEKGETSDAALQPWDKLAPGLQQSNREQVAFIGNILKKTGFTIGPSSAPKIIRFRLPEIEEMAKREHARWMMERIREGWIYGERKDVEKKISPSLRHWDDLPKNIQNFDREAVSLFPALLAQLGYEIQRQDENGCAG
jgi:ppGpp synthetase/RelA/SpoT-type nucleotidyltranferase